MLRASHHHGPFFTEAKPALATCEDQRDTRVESREKAQRWYAQRSTSKILSQNVSFKYIGNIVSLRLLPGAAQNTHDSSLLRLPPELKSRVWAFIFGRDEAYVGQCRIGEVAESKHGLSLLLACRQTYAEAVLLPFAIPRFWFY